MKKNLKINNTYNHIYANKLQTCDILLYGQTTDMINFMKTKPGKNQNVKNKYIQLHLCGHWTYYKPLNYFMGTSTHNLSISTHFFFTY